MSDYRAPLKDMQFVLDHVTDLSGLCALDAFSHLDAPDVPVVLEEAGKLAENVLSPLNRTGDEQGSRLENGVVTTPDGFRDAYRQYADGGWNGMPFEEAYGGGGLPWAVTMATIEMWNAANMSFSLCPLLNQGAVDAIEAHGTEEQKQTYLGKLIAGDWTATMNLTEPQAGSDVGALRTKATPAEDGSWRISGQKIYITYGEHDFTENIVHLVLARTPGAPPGTKGISLFIVPKFLPDENGKPGTPNDLRCVSLEHKIGIHASPTCVMSYGDSGECVGFLLGEENAGMRCMFTMMNNARLSVGTQGLAIAERAYQRALAYARERRQGRKSGMAADESIAIIEHADVRRMLMTMKARIEAMRCLIYANAGALDRARHEPNTEKRALQREIADVLTPLSKAWCTDLGVEIASIGVQVHGGMGFVEETGAGQHYRDARILPIYEGTNGIQALDLVGRKLAQAAGGYDHLISFCETAASELAATDDAALAASAASLENAVGALKSATEWMRAEGRKSADAAGAGATPYLQQFSATLGGAYLAKSAAIAHRLLGEGEGDPGFLKAKIETARFYLTQLLPPSAALLAAVTAGEEVLFAIPEEKLDA